MLGGGNIELERAASIEAASEGVNGMANYMVAHSMGLVEESPMPGNPEALRELRAQRDAPDSFLGRFMGFDNIDGTNNGVMAELADNAGKKQQFKEQARELEAAASQVMNAPIADRGAALDNLRDVTTRIAEENGSNPDELYGEAVQSIDNYDDYLEVNASRGAMQILFAEGSIYSDFFDEGDGYRAVQLLNGDASAHRILHSTEGYSEHTPEALTERYELLADNYRSAALEPNSSYWNPEMQPLTRSDPMETGPQELPSSQAASIPAQGSGESEDARDAERGAVSAEAFRELPLRAIDTERSPSDDSFPQEASNLSDNPGTEISSGSRY